MYLRFVIFKKWFQNLHSSFFSYTDNWKAKKQAQSYDLS